MYSASDFEIIKDIVISAVPVGDMSREELQSALGLHDRKSFRER